MRKNYTKTRAVLLAVILMLGALASTVSASDTIIPQCELSQHADPFDDYVVLIVVTYEIETNQPRVLYYNPCTLIGTSEDPIRDGLNYYTYAVNNPIMYFDPFGLSEIFVALRQWFDERMGWSWVSGGSLAWDDKSKTATVTIFQGNSSVTRSYTDGVNGTYIGKDSKMYVNAATLNSAFASVTREPSIIKNYDAEIAIVGTITGAKLLAPVAGKVASVAGPPLAAAGDKIKDVGGKIVNATSNFINDTGGYIRMNLQFFGNKFSSSPKNAKQVISHLQNNGFTVKSQVGSHVKLTDGVNTVTVPDYGSKDLAIGTLKAIMKQAGLE